MSFGCDKFTCERPCRVTGKGCGCKHMCVVEYMLLQEAKSHPLGGMIIGEVELWCTECGSKEYVKNGKVQVRREAEIPVQKVQTPVPGQSGL